MHGSCERALGGFLIMYIIRGIFDLIHTDRWSKYLIEGSFH